MSFDQIILWIIALGVLIGGLDRIFGNRLGLGQQFEEGFYAMGPLALGMVGIIVLTPIIAKFLSILFSPIFLALRLDPSLLAAVIAIDMGGYPLAMELAVDDTIGLYSGLIIASMLGCTLVFSIPVGLSLIEKKDSNYFAQGLLLGVIAIPIGSFVGGIVVGFSVYTLFINTIPVLMISILLSIGFLFYQKIMIKSFLIFSRCLVIVLTIGIAASAFTAITGAVIIPGMAPIADALVVVGKITIVLLGTFPTMKILTKILKKPLNRIGRLMGMNATGAAGILITLANSIPVYKMMKDMTPKEIIINTAWLVSATSALGAHLGFTAGIHPDMIIGIIIGKLAGGIVGITIVLSVFKINPSYALPSVHHTLTRKKNKA